jgi:hypothetical protein
MEFRSISYSRFVVGTNYHAGVLQESTSEEAVALLREAGLRPATSLELQEYWSEYGVPGAYCYSLAALGGEDPKVDLFWWGDGNVEHFQLPRGNKWGMYDAFLAVKD